MGYTTDTAVYPEKTSSQKLSEIDYENGRVVINYNAKMEHRSIINSIDPYEMQQALCKALTYSINGQEITFYAEGKELAKASNTIEDMGGFMDDGIYIGEQISYGIEGPITVHVTPGVNFVVGKILHYDDMPTISATVTMTESGPTLSDFKVD